MVASESTGSVARVAKSGSIVDRVVDPTAEASANLAVAAQAMAE